MICSPGHGQDKVKEKLSLAFYLVTGTGYRRDKVKENLSLKFDLSLDYGIPHEVAWTQTFKKQTTCLASVQAPSSVSILWSPVLKC